MLDGSREPTRTEAADFIGVQNAARWADLAQFIAANYSAKVLADIKQLLILKWTPKPGSPAPRPHVAP
jgi:hypothetical protein